MDLSLMKSVKTDELPTLLERAAYFGGKLTQANLDPLETTVVSIEVREDGRILIRMKERLPIREDRGLLFQFNYRDLYFRLNPGQFFVKGEVLFATLPNSARALTTRSNERYLMSPDMIISGAIHRTEIRQKQADLRGDIIDVSHSGLALRIRELQEGCLVPHDHIWLKEINEIPLFEPIFGKIVYAEGSRVGIALVKPLPEELFLELKSLSKLVLAV